MMFEQNETMKRIVSVCMAVSIHTYARTFAWLPPLLNLTGHKTEAFRCSLLGVVEATKYNNADQPRQENVASPVTCRQAGSIVLESCF